MNVLTLTRVVVLVCCVVALDVTRLQSQQTVPTPIGTTSLPSTVAGNSPTAFPSSNLPATGGASSSSVVGIPPTIPIVPNTAPVATIANNPTASPPASTVMPSVPSIEASGGQTNGSGQMAPKPLSRFDLPNSAGQQWVEYDIRPYTQHVKNSDRPQQAIIDWIIRETGTDVWFNEPMGVLSADRNTLRVYHTPAMQKVVAQIYERFVNGNNDPQVFGLRLITISNPNWRSRALPLMRSAPVQSPGVQAWLMPKENAAIFLAQMRERNDVREANSVDMALVQGQSQSLEQLRSRNYLREYQPNTTSAWPPFTPVSSEIQEGYKLVFSPLMSLDGKSVDVLVKCDIDQVERLNTVPIDLPSNVGQAQPAQVEVPQIVSWRLHERFRWPADQIMLLSCGVVAAPTGQINNTLLSGNSQGLFGMGRILPVAQGQRTDALLIIEYKGAASTQINPVFGAAAVANTPPRPQATSAQNSSPTAPVSRGRY